jgi:gluconolactonase
VTGLAQPNGIGLSPDGTILYRAQTSARQVLRRRLKAPGVIVPSIGASIASIVIADGVDAWSVLVGMPGFQEFDSLAVDSSGAVCVGTIADSGIAVVSADGSSVETYTLPADLADGAITNICFGGADLRTAFITGSQTGRVFAFQWPRPGLRLAYNA